MQRVIFSVFLLAMACAASAAAEKENPAPPEGKGDDLYARIVASYMDGQWDDLAKDLAAKPAEMAALSKAQKADVDYVRQAMVECRPAWWNTLKAVKKASFQVGVWGRTVDVTCDPGGKGGFRFAGGDPKAKLTFGSDVSSMDAPEHAEHSYSKGDLAGVGIWHSLGTAAGWSTLSPRSTQIIGERDNLRLGLYFDFRGNVTVLYYGTPAVRQWGLWLYLAAYMEKYAKMDIVNSRKAVAAMMVAEVLKSPATYPLFTLPDTLPDEGAEGKLALHFLSKLNRKNHWTIAEDKAFRAAVKAFAAANEQKTFDTAKAVLPNNLTVALFRDEDAQLQAQRDKFIKTLFDKIKAGGK
ncbi:MAG: hypothetical protein NT049_12020 [Planctomycetota bacterium]|nr:hypothetical protein [Planctomycetota bacterium]